MILIFSFKFKILPVKKFTNHLNNILYSQLEQYQSIPAEIQKIFLHNSSKTDLIHSQVYLLSKIFGIYCPWWTS
jgi:hypothetical protein